jgi:hypothetical protein
VIATFNFFSCGPAVQPCNLDGTLVSQAVICPDRASVGFGDSSTVVGASVTSGIELRNGGQQPLRISAVDAILPSAITVSALAPVNVGAGERVTLSFTFAPTEATRYLGTVVVHSNAERTADFSFTVAGCGRSPGSTVGPCG